MSEVDVAGTALDTSVVIAALLSWHEHHEVALPTVQQALAQPDGAILPLPALIESYSVMTRLPPPSRLAPQDAHALLVRTFSEARIVSLDGGEGWELIDGLARHQIAGGTAYDGQIVACARKAGADRIATFNPRHFARLDLGEIELVVPTKEVA